MLERPFRNPKPSSGESTVEEAGPSFAEYAAKMEEKYREFKENFEQAVVYEDEDVLVINKPAGIPSHATLPHHPMGIVELANQVRQQDIFLGHRLDKDTTGLLFLAKSLGAQEKLQDRFRQREVKKHYVAVVDGDWDKTIAGIIAPLIHPQDEKVSVSLEPEAKKAVTAFHEVAKLDYPGMPPRSLLKIRIYTGRTHQIRAHLKHLEFPITGDKVYNPDKWGFRRQMLHCFEMSMPHPTKEDKEIHVIAPLPNDFRNFVRSMRVQEEDPEEWEQIMATR